MRIDNTNQGNFSQKWIVLESGNDELKSTPISDRWIEMVKRR